LYLILGWDDVCLLLADVPEPSSSQATLEAGTPPRAFSSGVDLVLPASISDIPYSSPPRAVSSDVEALEPVSVSRIEEEEPGIRGISGAQAGGRVTPLAMGELRIPPGIEFLVNDTSK
jgi:hypothetical protein